MRRTIIAAVTCLLLASSAQILAQSSAGQYRYTWKDDQGQPHYSDSLTNQAIKNGYEVVNDQGMIVRHVPRALTAEEHAHANAVAAKAADARHAQEQQRQADRQMMAAYPTEQSFVAAQQAELDHIDQTIHTTQLNLHSQEENLAELLAHAAGMQSNGDTVPKSLADRITRQRATVTAQRRMLERQHDKRQAAVQREQRQLRHYHDVRARMQAQLSGQ